MNTSVVRAKFKCTFISKPLPDEYPGTLVKFNPVMPEYKDGMTYWPEGSGDNASFWEATPSGELQMWVKNQQAVARFVEGQAYYIDFTPAN